MQQAKKYDDYIVGMKEWLSFGRAISLSLDPRSHQSLATETNRSRCGTEAPYVGAPRQGDRSLGVKVTWGESGSG